MKNCEIIVVLELGSCKRGDSGRSKTKSIGNRFRMLSPLLPAPSPLFLLLLLLLQSLRDFTIPTALSSAATQRCTSTTAGRKSATVASATTRSRCGRGMRWPQTTLWSLAGCFDEEEKRDDRKEEDDAPAMSQAEGKASLRASREAWGGRQEGQERSEEWNRCPQLDFFFFYSLLWKKKQTRKRGRDSFLSSLFSLPPFRVFLQNHVHHPCRGHLVRRVSRGLLRLLVRGGSREDDSVPFGQACLRPVLFRLSSSRVGSAVGRRAARQAPSM